MVKKELKTLGTILLILLAATGLAIAGSQGGVTIWGGFPLFAFDILLAFFIQWIAFIPSYIKKTEKYYDLTGSITYSTVFIISILLSPSLNIRSIILLIMVLIWTGRLGFFLFRRVLKAGKDKRFDTLKESGLDFFQTWTLQGLWVSFTAAAALAAITASNFTSNIFDWFGLIVGGIIWLVGFSFEAIADHQKREFIENPENKGKFINVGLWAYSRHPNYFGEITLWFGIALIALPSLAGWRFVTLISPIFVALLITQVSGIPLLEDYADDKWGGQEDYEKYKRNTPILIPKFKK